MTRAILVRELGGPGVLEWGAVELGEPGPGEAVVRHAAIGLNFIDVYFRNGTYPGPACPFVPGTEAAGTVEAVGPGVEDVAVGDRVAYACRPLGAYSEARVVPADRLVRLPDGIEFEQAAALMLKGMTAQYLLRRSYPVRAGETILVHAAAGGVGTLLCQWASHLGARVIGTVGSQAKAAEAVRNGCHEAILYRDEDFVARTLELTEGRGVSVVYDSVGRDTLAGSLDVLTPLGMFVSFGQSSGAPEPLSLGELGRRGSLFATRPSLMDYTAEREDLLAISGELFEAIGAGVIQARIGARWPLQEAADAHRALEARRTVGATLLVP